MSSSNKQQTQSSQSSESAPWSVQTPYLTTAFNDAQSALTKAQGATAPTNFTAQFTPDQLGAFSQMLRYGTGNPNIASSSANAGSTLNTAGANGAAGALTRLAGYTPTGNVAADVAGGNSFVNGMNIPALVKAQMLPAEQAASEQTLPQIGRDAAGSGNINSSRTAISKGIVERGLGQQAEANAANLQGQGFNTGAALTEQSNEANNSNLLTSIMAALNGGNQSVATGTNANTGAVGQQGGLFNIASSGAAGQNAGSQANLTNQEQQFEAQTNDPFAALNNFYNIIGANNWGGTQTGSGTSTTTSTPSIWQTIGGLMSAGGSLLHSDQKLKKDIHLIGELFNGLQVYRFRYKNDPTNTLHVGLMAQDVELDKPEAVVRDAHGYLMVNYDLATQDAILD